MKKENRVRAKSKSTATAKQTKKQPKLLPFELRSAGLFLANFYKQRCQFDRKPAFNDLLGMYHLTKSIPELQKPACFLNMLIEGEGTLYDIFGTRDLPNDYPLRMAGIWFCNYYERLNSMNYANAIFECRGVEELLRGNRRFFKVADALRQIIFGHEFMLKFCSETISEEELKTGSSEEK